MLHVLMGDDHALFRRGARDFLLQNFSPILVEEAECGAEMIQLAAAPNHQHIVETADYKHGMSESEVVETGTTRYLKVNRKWRSHSYDARAEAAQIGHAMQASKATCTNAGTSDSDGRTATTFRVHNQSDDATIDQQIWIGANGLPLKQVIDTDVGGALGKSHREIRYDYADVQPPKI